MSVYVIIPFHATDYGHWKEIFDEYSNARDAWGAEGYVVYRGLDDPNSVTVVHYFADREGAERFMRDPSMPDGKPGDMPPFGKDTLDDGQMGELYSFLGAEFK